MSDAPSASSSQRQVVLLALVVIAACVAFALWLRASGTPDPGARVAPDAAEPTSGEAPPPRLTGAVDSRRADTQAPPPAEVDAVPPWEPVTVEGTTRFQRRLSLGEGLLRLSRRLERHPAEAARIGQHLGELWGDLLPLHDLVGRAPAPYDLADPDKLPGFLAWLVDPRRDRAVFRLHAVEPVEDPLGRDALLRVWTLAPAGFDRAALVRARHLLERLLERSGTEDDAGFDVLATPNRGLEVFRFDPAVPFPLAGYYAPTDDFAVISTAWPDDFLRLLLAHELVHAWQTRHLGRWRSRALEEGLAETLMWLEPDDLGLAVPVDRLRDNLAALRGLLGGLRQAGLSNGPDLPARLLALSPSEFMALGHLGYLLAQAFLAYVGSDPVEGAVARREEGVLARAVEEIEWDAFLAWLDEASAGGDAAGVTLVRDVTGPELERRQERSRNEGLERAMRQLGIRVPRGWDDDDLAAFTRALPPLPANAATDLAAVLERIVAAGSAPRVAIDGTRALEAPFRLAPGAGEAPGGIDLPALDRADRLGFVTAFVEELDRRLGEGKPTLALLREGGLAEAWPLRPEGVRFSTWNLSRALRDERGLVVLVASREDVRGAIAKAMGPGVAPDDGRVDAALGPVLAGAYQEAGAKPAAVLVVDLADGASDAEAIATAFHVLLEGRGVVLWNPQQPLR